MKLLLLRGQIECQRTESKDTREVAREMFEAVYHHVILKISDVHDSSLVGHIDEVVDDPGGGFLV
jgi:hypothetical protein